jgi:TolB-like protein
MNTTRLLVVILCFALFGSVQAQDMDKVLSELAAKLAKNTQEAGKTKITVADFSDLQGNANELGKFVAEELTVNLVMVKSNFSVLDRANLKKILAEHKLTSTGLIDPDNAKKLGQFAGVDALILGTIVARGHKVSVTAKIITTDTAEIVGAAKAEFASDDSTEKLLAKSAEAPKASATNDSQDQKPTSIKFFGDFGVGLESLRVVNGRTFSLSMTLTNQNPKRSVWVALSIQPNGVVKSSLTDSDSFEFEATTPSGIAAADLGYEGKFYKATEIGPGDSIPVSLNFFSTAGKDASPGSCRLRLEFLQANRMNGNMGGSGTTRNLAAKMEAN